MKRLAFCGILIRYIDIRRRWVRRYIMAQLIRARGLETPATPSIKEEGNLSRLRLP